MENDKNKKQKQRIRKKGQQVNRKRFVFTSENVLAKVWVRLIAFFNILDYIECVFVCLFEERLERRISIILYIL